MNKELKKALEDFKEDAMLLAARWSKATDDEKDKLQEHYPFEKDFDDIITEIIVWYHKTNKEVE